MKKLALFFLMIVIIIVGISYMYLNYKANYYEAKKENNQFESYYEQEFYGAEVVTLINKAIDNNLNGKILTILSKSFFKIFLFIPFAFLFSFFK